MMLEIIEIGQNLKELLMAVILLIVVIAFFYFMSKD